MVYNRHLRLYKGHEFVYKLYINKENEEHELYILYRRSKFVYKLYIKQEELGA
jgi:hypothetical protein